MRFATFFLLITGLLLAGCAPQGTILRKEFRPLPFSESLGIPGIFRFELRDREGHIRSQMVTPEVFAQYEVGEYFNDREKPKFRGETPGRPEGLPQPVLRPRPLQDYGTPYRPMRFSGAKDLRAPAVEVRRATLAHPRRGRVAGRHRKRMKKAARVTKPAQGSLYSLGSDAGTAAVGFRY